MTPMFRLRQLLIIAAFAAIGLASTAADVFATHFRYGTITWQVENPATPNVVKVKFSTAFRWSFPYGGATSTCPPAPFVRTGGGGSGECPPLGRVITSLGNIEVLNAAGTAGVSIKHGPTQTTSTTIPIQAVVNFISTTEDWFTASFETTVIFPVGTQADYTLRWRSNARLSTLKDNNQDTFWTLTTRVTVRQPPALVNQPPTAATAPIIRLAAGQPFTYQIPVSDPDGHVLSFRLSTLLESELRAAQPALPAVGQPGRFNLSSAGLITWTPPSTAPLPALYGIQIRATDTEGAYTVVDLLLSVQATIGNPPTVGVTTINGKAEPNPTQPKSIIALLGQLVSFVISAADPEGSPLVLQGTGLPPTSLNGSPGMSPALPLTSVNASSTFTFTPSAPAVGTYLMNFSATDADGMQTTNSVTLEVVNATVAEPTITAVFANPSATGFGQPVILSATAEAGTAAPTGRAQFFVDGVLVGTGDLVADDATHATGSFAYDGALAGNHSVTARYVGAASNGVYYESSISATSAPYSVSTSPTTTTITSSPNPSQLSQGVSFTVTVNPPAGYTLPPAGLVTLKRGGTTIANGTLTGGARTFTLTDFAANTFTVGTHNLTAEYSGVGGGYLASTSAAYTHTVTEGSTTTVLVSAPNPSSWSNNFTMSATVAQVFGTSKPTGTVTFSIPGIPLGTATVNASGVATISGGGILNANQSAFPFYTITATYNGEDANFSPSSADRVHVVIKANPNITVTAPATSTYGQAVTVSVKVDPPGNTGRQVRLLEGGVQIAGPVTVQSQGIDMVATLTLPLLNAGLHNLVAETSGGLNEANLVNGTKAFTHTVNAAGTMITGASSAPNPSALGQGFSLTANVTTAQAPFAPVASGSVTFKRAGVVIAGPVTPNPAGVATANVSNLAPFTIGDHQITAEYSGGAPNFGNSVSAPFTHTVIVGVTFSQPFAAHAGCICTPLLMNTNTSGTQTWYVKATGAGPLTITSIARAVNSTDPETVVANVYDAAGALQFTLNSAYGPGTASDTEVADSDSIAAPAAGAVYRVEISTPSTPPTQPHYRLKFQGAEVAGTASPSSPSFEDAHQTKWYFNTAASEALNIRLFVTGTPATETTVNYTLTDPVGTVSTGSATANTTDATISGAAVVVPGTWTLVLDDASDHSTNPANGHYGLDKTGGADRGVYLAWDSAGAGTLRLRAVTGASGGPAFTGPVTFGVTGPNGFTFTQVSTTGAIDLEGLAPGQYAIGADAPPGWSINAGPYVIDVLCDEEATQELVVADPIPPVVTVPGDISLAATELGGAHATFAVSADDPGRGTVPVTCSANSGDLFPFGQTLVTCTAEDDANNVGEATFIVHVTDQTVPVITAPGPMTVAAANAAGAAVQFNVSAADSFSTLVLMCEAIGPNGPISLGPISESKSHGGLNDGGDGPGGASFAGDGIFPLGVSTVTCRATDSANNTVAASFTVTVGDTTPPNLTAPAAITVGTNDGATYAGGIGDATATDNVSIATAITITSNAPAAFPLGNTTVIWTATDAAGNSSTASQVVTVVDDDPPSITAPANASRGTNVGATFVGDFGTATATDNASSGPGLVITNDAPAAFPLGTTTVKWTATDEAGNFSSATQDVTVADDDAPSISAPAAASFGTNVGATYVGGIGTATASDNVPAGLTVTNDAPAAFPIGTTTVTWTATDAAGNVSSATQDVTVADDDAPSITAPIAVSTGTNAGATFVGDIGTATASDNVPAGLVVTNDAPAAFPLGATTVTWTATDAAGNATSATQVVTVEDDDPPSITAPAAETFGTNDGATYVGPFGTATATDNASSGAALVITNDAPAAFPLGATTVTWTATDAAGNATSATQVVTVEDDDAPSITAPASESFGTNDGATYVGPFGTATATDNASSGAALVITNDAPAAFPLGATTVTWTATDAAGNATSATQVVTVSDDDAPALTAPAALTVGTNTGGTYVGGIGTATATDNVSSGAALVITSNAPAIFPLGATTVTWTATDAAGNATTATQVVTVVDDDQPVVTAPANKSVNATSAAGAVVTYTGQSATDNVSAVTATCVPASGSTFAVGTTIVTCSATDAAGNTGTATFTVTVNPTGGTTTVGPGQTMTFDAGTVGGNLTVNGGTLVLANGTEVTGNVQMTAGSTLSVIGGSSVGGNVTLTGNGSVSVAGGTVEGNLSVSNGGTFNLGAGAVLEGQVQLSNTPAGRPASTMCGATVSKNVTIQNNASPVSIGETPSCAGNMIDGQVQITGNTGQIKLFNNIIDKQLQCSGNTVISGSGNTASAKQGQCSAF